MLIDQCPIYSSKPNPTHESYAVTQSKVPAARSPYSRTFNPGA